MLEGRRIKRAKEPGMKISNIHQAKQWFEVLQTTDRTQAAVMRLDPGKATGEHAEAHEKSEQLLCYSKAHWPLRSAPNVWR
jgi:hypothetical protein